MISRIESLIARCMLLSLLLVLTLGGSVSATKDDDAAH